MKEFFSNTPAEVIEALSGSRDSAAAALEANITRIRHATDVLKPESPVRQQLKQFVRVQASKVARPKKAEEKFDLVENMLGVVCAEQLEKKPAYTLIQGGTGSGKSAFIRFLEFKLWALHDKDPAQPIPLYISLAHAHHATTNLMEEALSAIGLDESGIQQLKREQTFVILMDGFDELGKEVNLYRSNNLSEWRAHVVIGARTQFLQSLSDYQSLFTNETHNSVDERYIMPFTSEQIQVFLDRFARGPDAQGHDAEALRSQLESIGGLWELLSTPFLLHMACLCLPILERGLVPSKGLPLQINRRHLYESFVSLMHGREMWRCVTRRRLPIDVSREQNQPKKIHRFLCLCPCLCLCLCLCLCPCLCLCLCLSTSLSLFLSVCLVTCHLYRSKSLFFCSAHQISLRVLPYPLAPRLLVYFFFFGPIRSTCTTSCWSLTKTLPRPCSSETRCRLASQVTPPPTPPQRALP